MSKKRKSRIKYETVTCWGCKVVVPININIREQKWMWVYKPPDNQWSLYCGKCVENIRIKLELKPEAFGEV